MVCGSTPGGTKARARNRSDGTRDPPGGTSTWPHLTNHSFFENPPTHDPPTQPATPNLSKTRAKTSPVVHHGLQVWGCVRPPPPWSGTQSSVGGGGAVNLQVWLQLLMPILGRSPAHPHTPLRAPLFPGRAPGPSGSPPPGRRSSQRLKAAAVRPSPSPSPFGGVPLSLPFQTNPPHGTLAVRSCGGLQLEAECPRVLSEPWYCRRGGSDQSPPLN